MGTLGPTHGRFAARGAPCADRPLVAFVLLVLSVASAARGEDAAVVLSEDESSYTLANGIVAAKVSKGNGNLSSLVYRGVEVLAAGGSRPLGVWSHEARSPEMIRRVTIDPTTNGGEQGEISVMGISKGQGLGSGPGGPFIADIELRFSLGRGDSGIYTYAIFDHRPEYPASTLGEARFCCFLSPTFDWMSVDPTRNKYYPRQPDRLDLTKYRLTGNQFDNPAFGWSSTEDKVGFWFVNPSLEYMSGGPTKIEFLCHKDTRIGGASCVLNYWRSSHYGGSSAPVAQGESWTKVIGPFLLYCNAGNTPDVMWEDAKQQAAREAAKWPFAWVQGVDYPGRDGRGSVSGKLVLDDPGQPSAALSRWLVGLSHPDYVVSDGSISRTIDWQLDAKHYEFWVRGNPDGTFQIPNVRPGSYTLHAIADGVLDEFAKTDVVVSAGGTLDLGHLRWTPLRHGKQLWEIGVPNRNALEFLHGDQYNRDESPLAYSRLFAQDQRFVIGKNDFSRDWYYAHVPHVDNMDDPAARVMPAASRTSLLNSIGYESASADSKQAMEAEVDARAQSGRYATGRATPWTIEFELPRAVRGTATLRLAICGTGSRSLDVSVNDKPLPSLRDLRVDGTINRYGKSGLWYEREVRFDAALLKAGTNQVTLTVPAGPVTNGLVYDYLRLELDEPPQSPLTLTAGLDPPPLLPAPKPGTPSTSARNYPRTWWPDYRDRDDEWFRASEANRIAANILTWQSDAGSWPLMNTTNEPWMGDRAAIGPWGTKGTFVSATTDEMRFLSRAYRANGNDAHKQAVLKAVDHLLKAQYPSGGWPQSYPPAEGYKSRITFNDGAMVRVMRMLHELANSPDYPFLDNDRKQAAQSAFDRGLDCILKCQIVVGGTPTVWCQQHDEHDYRPQSARVFEPAALCGGSESAEILQLLMSIETPNAIVIRAIHGGAAWFDRSKIEGIRVVRANGDTAVTPDPSAPPTWARFYEVETNRPIFVGRDGIKKYDVEEIDQERQGGYAWYGNWGQAVARDYAKWKAIVNN